MPVRAEDRWGGGGQGGGLCGKTAQGGHAGERREGRMIAGKEERAHSPVEHLLLLLRANALVLEEQVEERRLREIQQGGRGGEGEERSRSQR